MSFPFSFHPPVCQIVLDVGKSRPIICNVKFRLTCCILVLDCWGIKVIWSNEFFHSNGNHASLLSINDYFMEN